ncbi:MAG: S41 family peptidase [Pseudomonadota bacterium]
MKRTKLALAAAGLLFSALSLAQQPPGPPPQADMTVDAAQRQLVIDGVIRELRASYVFPELAKKVELDLRQRQKRGAYAAITSAEKLSKTLTDDIRALTNDKHLRVSYSAEPLPEMSKDKKPDAEQQAAELADMKAQNFGIERVERLPFNVGYFALNAFAPAKTAADSIAAAMTVLGNTDALIIDLRKNGGGDPSTVTMLASYFLDERTHMTDIYYREGDRTEQMWSSDNVAGTRYGQKKDVYILTSKYTFSAAEDFSFAMKNLKRVTIVGETTGGGAHPGDVTRLNEHFDMFVPNGRSMNPVTKLDWEVVGVAPDIATSADDALKTAQVAILKKIAAAEKNVQRQGRINARIAQMESKGSAGAAP